MNDYFFLGFCIFVAIVIFLLGVVCGLALATKDGE